MISNFKLPIFYIPRFQQGGGLVYANNVYSGPTNNNALMQILGQPRATGYEQGLQNAQLLNQGLQVYNQTTNQAAALAESQIRNNLMQQRLEAEKQSFEFNKLQKELEQRATWRDELTNDDVDPVFKDQLVELQAKYGIDKLPDNYSEFGDYQKKLFNYYNDPNYRNIKETSLLTKDLTQRINTLQTNITDAILKDPTLKFKANIQDYQKAITDTRREISNLAFTDADGDGILDDNVATKYKQLASKIDEINFTLTPEYEEQIKTQFDSEIAVNKAKAAKDTATAKQIIDMLPIEQELKGYEVEMLKYNMEALRDALEGVEDPDERLKILNQWKAKYLKGDNVITSLDQAAADVYNRIMANNPDADPLEVFGDIYSKKNTKSATVDYNSSSDYIDVASSGATTTSTYRIDSGGKVKWALFGDSTKMITQDTIKDIEGIELIPMMQDVNGRKIKVAYLKVDGNSTSRAELLNTFGLTTSNPDNDIDQIAIENGGTYDYDEGVAYIPANLDFNNTSANFNDTPGPSSSSTSEVTPPAWIK